MLFKDCRIFHGDCLDVLKKLPNGKINLILTSPPPYANQRKHTYGGIDSTKYVDWFLPISEQLHRVLANDGSFILNIKENVKDGERDTYVLKLILALREQGWLWTEEYIWHKQNAYPGKWDYRLRDAWERLLHFTKNRHFKMFQDSVKVPIGKWIEKEPKQKDFREQSASNSGFGRNRSHWEGKEFVLPDNVLYLPVKSSTVWHSAVMPDGIPKFFIPLLTEKDDWVLDPFMGSGTTLKVGIGLNRRVIGIDRMGDYCTKVARYLNGKLIEV